MKPMNIVNSAGSSRKGHSFIDREKHVIGRMIRSCLELGSVLRLLDVGCGYGRNLQYLSNPSLTIVGVDANRVAVEYNRAKGFACYMPDGNEWRR